MSTLSDAMKTAKQRTLRVVFPEKDDKRVQKASKKIEELNIARPIFLDEVPPNDIMVDALCKRRPKISRTSAAKLLNRPLYHAAAIVASGYADTMVAGAVFPTRKIVEATSLVIGVLDGIKTPSSFFLMIFPNGQEFIFSDCALNINPNSQELKDIASASIATAQQLFSKTCVAMLSYSTGKSGVGPTVDVVTEATNKMSDLDVPIIGPVQVDAALDLEIATKKGLKNTQKPNVLIFPSLDAGNIGYKLCRELAGAEAIGPILQGYLKPVCDLSRGATIQEIIAGTTIALALA